jgi:hypothetical protein
VGTAAKPARTLAATPAALPEPAANEGLAKAVQNPVASLISVPFQNNSNFNLGPYNRTQDVLNIQPVMPVNFSKNWMVITRIIQPIVWQPYPEQNTGGQYGLGDMNPTFFLAPRNSGKLIWGVGPTLIVPTATNETLGQGKFSLGPSIVLLTQPGHWTIGALVNNAWSIAGSGGRPDVNQMLLQYFINYNLKKGWYVSSSPIITADWQASSSNMWTVPFGGGIGKISNLGLQPVNIQTTFYGNAVSPTGGATWSMRLQLALLFPKLTSLQQKMLLEKKLKNIEEQEQQQRKAQPKG